MTTRFEDISDFGYITNDVANQMIEEIEETSKLLNGYIFSINKRKGWDE